MKISNLEKVAASYVKLLDSLDWEDSVMMSGLSEGLNKFLSNAFLKSQSGHKYQKGDFYSAKAVSKIQARDFSDLRYEHMVPKDKYIQKVCVEKAAKGALELDFVINILRKYWHIAIITKEEDALLVSRKMPKDWDGVNIFQRYHDSGVSLISNPFVSQEEIWSMIMSLLDGGDQLHIKNTSGKIGVARFESGSLVIDSERKKYKYPHHTKVRQLFFDGWYFDA